MSLLDFFKSEETTPEPSGLEQQSNIIDDAVLKSADLENQGGKITVAGAFFELYHPFGEMYGWNEKKIDTDELLRILNDAGITREEINTLINTELGSLNEEGYKKHFNSRKHPELWPIRKKLAEVLKKELVTA